MADRLGVRLLGEFRLDGVELDALRSRQARTLLKRLALERGGTVGADSLVEAVWPAGRPAQPDRDLHVLVSRARTVVGADRVVRRDAGYALTADWWDVDELATLTREAVRRADTGDLVGARTAAEGALSLVRGHAALRRAGRGVGGGRPLGGRCRGGGGTPGRGNRCARHGPGGRRGGARHRCAERPIPTTRPRCAR